MISSMSICLWGSEPRKHLLKERKGCLSISRWFLPAPGPPSHCRPCLLQTKPRAREELVRKFQIDNGFESGETEARQSQLLSKGLPKGVTGVSSWSQLTNGCGRWRTL